MNDAIASESGTVQNLVREVVGVFDSLAHLEVAVEQLGIAGIGRAAMFVLRAAVPHAEERRRDEDDVAPLDLGHFR